MVKVVVPETLEIHIFKDNSVNLIVQKIPLDPKESSVIIDRPHYRTSDCFWFSIPEGGVPGVIKTVEIVQHEEISQRACGSYVEILQKNIGKKVVVTKKVTVGSNEFTEVLEGTIKEVCGNQFFQMETSDSKMLVCMTNNIHSILSVETGKELELFLPVSSIRKKMKLNYFTKEKTFVYLTYVDRSMSLVPGYRLYMDEEKKIGGLKLEVRLQNNSGLDIRPKLWNFHFGFPIFPASFALGGDRNLFVLNAKNNVFPAVSKLSKANSVCYKHEGLTVKANSSVVVPIFETSIKFDKVFSCSLVESTSSLDTRKIVRLKNTSSLPWTQAEVVLSNTSRVFAGKSVLPYTKVTEGAIAEIELKRATSVKVFYNETIEKIIQIKQKRKKVIGEAIVLGKVRVKNYKKQGKEILVVMKYSFSGKYTDKSASIKPTSVVEEVVDDDLNPVKTTITFSLKTSSKKKKFTFKFTRWSQQDQMTGNMRNVQMDSFFNKPRRKPTANRQQRRSRDRRRRRSRSRSYSEEEGECFEDEGEMCLSEDEYSDCDEEEEYDF